MQHILSAFFSILNKLCISHLTITPNTCHNETSARPALPTMHNELFLSFIQEGEQTRTSCPKNNKRNANKSFTLRHLFIPAAPFIILRCANRPAALGQPVNYRSGNFKIPQR